MSTMHLEHVRFLRPSQNCTGHFRDVSLQTITFSGTNKEGNK